MRKLAKVLNNLSYFCHHYIMLQCFVAFLTLKNRAIICRGSSIKLTYSERYVVVCVHKWRDAHSSTNLCYSIRLIVDRWRLWSNRR